MKGRLIEFTIDSIIMKQVMYKTIRARKKHLKFREITIYGKNIQLTKDRERICCVFLHKLVAIPIRYDKSLQKKNWICSANC